jgi:hypothetical protein
MRNSIINNAQKEKLNAKIAKKSTYLMNHSSILKNAREE